MKPLFESIPVRMLEAIILTSSRWWRFKRWLKKLLGRPRSLSGEEGEAIMLNDKRGLRLRCARHRTVALAGRFDWGTDPVDTETMYVDPCPVCATEIEKAQNDIAGRSDWFPADWLKARGILVIKWLVQVKKIDFKVTLREANAQAEHPCLSHQHTEISIDRALVRTFDDVGAGLRGEIALHVEGLRLATREATGGKKQP